MGLLIAKDRNSYDGREKQVAKVYANGDKSLGPAVEKILWRYR